MRLHFISGLPRSGSTLLAAVLRQNPRFSAGMTGPVSSLFQAMESATAGNAETSVFVSDGARERLLKGVFELYYQDTDRPVVFDTSRVWCSRLPLLAKLFPEAKVIACVRELGWIGDSFERLYRRNGQKPSAIYDWTTGGTVWSRTSALMASSGVIGFAYDALREAHASEQRGNMLLLDYENLCKSPRQALKAVYRFIDEPYFDHDFSHVEYSENEFDKRLGADGLHTVNGGIAWRPRETILPPDLFARYSNDNFWRR